jgi:DNA-binding CsgD family transcriptional regulator
MTIATCTLFWVLTPLLIIAAAIAWALETDTERACRWRQGGLSQQRIADRLGCSRWKVRQMLA